MFAVFAYFWFGFAAWMSIRPKTCIAFFIWAQTDCESVQSRTRLLLIRHRALVAWEMHGRNSALSAKHKCPRIPQFTWLQSHTRIYVTETTHRRLWLCWCWALWHWHRAQIKMDQMELDTIWTKRRAIKSVAYDRHRRAGSRAKSIQHELSLLSTLAHSVHSFYGHEPGCEPQFFIILLIRIIIYIEFT